MVMPFLTASTGHDLHGGARVVAGKEDAIEYGLEAIVGHRSTSKKLVAEFLFAGDLRSTDYTRLIGMYDAGATATQLANRPAAISQWCCSN
jgi:hypothetical protein